MYQSSRSDIGRVCCLRIAAAFIAAFAFVPVARSADEPDVIFKRSTVFKWLTPNDKLATYGLDDPEVDGVACHFTVPERGGLKGLALPKRYRISRYRAVSWAQSASNKNLSKARTCSECAARYSSRKCKSCAAAT